MLRTANEKSILSPWCTIAGPDLTTSMPGCSFVLTNVQRTVSPAATLMLAVRVATAPVLSLSVQVIDESR